MSPDDMIGVGILGKIPVLSCNVEVNLSEQQAIAVSISSLMRTAPLCKHKDYVKGTGTMHPRRFKLNGKVGWDKTIPALYGQTGEESLWARTYAEGNVPPATLNVFHSCPVCRGLETSQRKCFQRYNLDMKAKCGFCLKQTATRDWKCSCGVAWHSCEIHKYGYKSQLCDTKPQPANNKAEAAISISHKGGVKRSRAWAIKPRYTKSLRITKERIKRAGITLEAANTKVFKGPLPFTPGPLIANKADELGFTCFAPL
jgi:hypothetical protein